MQDSKLLERILKNRNMKKHLHSLLAEMSVYLEPRLKQYLESDCEILPDDKNDYLESGPLKDCCIFCGETVPKYEQVEKVWGKYNKCSTCFGWMVSYMRKKESSKNFIKLPAIFRKRQEKYRKGELTDEVFTDTYSRFSCYFCGVNAVTSPYHIELPVTPVTIGGYHKVCEKHADQFGTDAHWGDVSICVKCGEPYPISKDEQNSRDFIHTNGKHMCYICTKNTHKKYLESLKRHDIARNVYITCECGTSVTADITLLLDSSDIPIGNEKYKCKNCMKTKYPDAKEILREPMFDRDYTLIVYQSLKDGSFDFDIYVKALPDYAYGKDENVLVYKHKTGFLNPYDCVTKAYEWLIHSKEKQKKLFGDE